MEWVVNVWLVLVLVGESEEVLMVEVLRIRWDGIWYTTWREDEM